MVWGLALVLAAGLSGRPLLFFCGVGFLVVWGMRSGLSRLHIALIIAFSGFLYGYGHGSIENHRSHILHISEIAPLQKRPVWLEGWVASYPQPSYGGRRFEFVSRFDGAVHRLLVRAPEFRIDYGDSLRLLVRFRERSDESDRRYFLGRGVCGSASAMKGSMEVLPGRGGGWVVRYCLWPVHDRLRRDTAKGLGAWAGVPLALLLGERGAISRRVRDGFVQLGISHLLALSGFHLGFVAGLLVVMTRLLRIRSTRLVVASLVFYVATVGPILSLYRALVMALLIAFARGVHRPGQPVTALATAFLVILIVLPFAFFAVGFQLSFLATFGVLVTIRRLPSPPAAGWVRRTLYWVWATVVVSVAVQVLLIPVLLVYFGRISLVAPLATVLFVAPVMAVLTLTVASAATAMAFPTAAVVLYEVTTFAAQMFDSLLTACVRIVPPSLEVPAPNPYVFYLGIGLLWVHSRNRLLRLGGALIVVAAWLPWSDF